MSVPHQFRLPLQRRRPSRRPRQTLPRPLRVTQPAGRVATTQHEGKKAVVVVGLSEVAA